MKRTIQILLGVKFLHCYPPLCSRVHSGSLDAAQIRAKLDAIPLDQQVDLTNEEWQTHPVPATVLCHAPSGHGAPVAER